MKAAGPFYYTKIVLAIFTIFGWLAIPATRFFITSATDEEQQCASGQMSARLTGTAGTGTTARGTARYSNRGNSRFMVEVRSVNLAAGTVLTVLVNEINVGRILLPRNGNSQLRIDAPTATVTEGSNVTVRNGTTEILSGIFACTGEGGNSNTGANVSSNTSGETNIRDSSNGNSNANPDTLTRPTGTPGAPPRTF